MLRGSINNCDLRSRSKQQDKETIAVMKKYCPRTLKTEMQYQHKDNSPLFYRPPDKINADLMLSDSQPLILPKMLN